MIVPKSLLVIWSKAVHISTLLKGIVSSLIKGGLWAELSARHAALVCAKHLFVEGCFFRTGG